MTSEPSGRLYTAITRHWPRIATALVVVLGLVELVASGLTADSGVEFYLMAWAGTTGGLWFLFEKAETALSEESRATVLQWMERRDTRPVFEAVPIQFAMLFDRVFGERHWSKKCFRRSSAASVTSGLLVFGLLLSLGRSTGDQAMRFVFLGASGCFLGLWFVIVRIYPDPRKGPWAKRAVAALSGALGAGFWPVYFFSADLPEWFVGSYFGITAFAFFALANFLPDYLSLLETRWAIGYLSRGRRYAGVLIADVLFTWMIWALALVLFLLILPNPIAPDDRLGRATTAFWEGLGPPGQPLVLLSPPTLFEWLFRTPRTASFDMPLRVSFFSTFLTSVWLWLYAASVLVSRVLLKMNSGVGFLLRVTDVERQPFRSMGFVSVIIVSGLFALGLPFVLL